HFVPLRSRPLSGLDGNQPPPKRILPATGAQESNHWYRRLLRARRERPRSCRAAENGDELASSQGWHGLPPPRAAGFPHPQPSTEGLAGPWGNEGLTVASSRNPEDADCVPPLADERATIVTSRAEHYRQLARNCHFMARSIPPGT